MNISTHSYKEFDGAIIPLFEDQLNINDYTLPLKKIVKSDKFKGKYNTTYSFTKENDHSIHEIVFVGLGKKEDMTYRRLQRAIATAYRTIKKKTIKTLAVVMNLGNAYFSKDDVLCIAEALPLADYTFDDYKNLGEQDQKDSVIKVSLLVESSIAQTVNLEESLLLAELSIEARNMVNIPSNDLTPSLLAKRAEFLGEKNGFDVEVLGKKDIEKLGMTAYMSVAKGSTEKPKFIIMRYNGNPSSDARLGLVGKGLTYDSGGYSIKSTKGMSTMKSDMAGAATVIATMAAISRMKLKTNVTAVVAACENMIAGNAYKPGDIIGSMGGKSIFIGNSDAEGRLTLIDAMHYIVTKESVDRVIDIATLTGSAISCTGDQATVAISNDDQFFHQLNTAYNDSGEYVWRMPIFDEYKELIKHSEADLTNNAGQPGTITAGLFIGEFTNDLPWIHLDIAGSSWANKLDGIYCKGGTATGVRPLYHLAKKL